jgi:hypothetical protein
MTQKSPEIDEIDERGAEISTYDKVIAEAYLQSQLDPHSLSSIPDHNVRLALEFPRCI